MVDETAKLRVTAKVKILKYAEGETPDNAEPFETVEKEIVFVGEEAAQIIKEMGGNVNGTN